MPSEYHGVYSHVLESGTITSVQCEDRNGNGIDLPIEQYIERDIQPPAESLPTQHEYQP